MTEALAEVAAARVVSVVVVVASPPATRSRSRRRARVVVLAAVATFLALQFGLSRAIEADALPVRDPIYSEKFDLLRTHGEFFAASPPRPRLLAVGSSRTLLALDADALGTKLNAAVFNFGCHGCGPITTALSVRRLFAAGVRAETVLIELHPAMLANHDPPYEHRWLHEYRLKSDEVGVLRGYGWRLPTPVQHRPAGWLETTHTYRVAALDRYAPELLACPFGMTLAGRTDRFGFVRGADIPPADRRPALLRECGLYLPAFAHYRPGGAAVAAVRDTIDCCQSHGATPILLLSAESSAFRSWYGTAGNARLREWVDHFARETGTRLIDAREWVADADCVDGHHLTASGAEAFTARLAEELRR